MDSTADTPRFEHDIAIVGAGRVGQALGLLLRRAGARIVAVSGRSPASAQAAALATGGRATTDGAQAARGAEVVLVTVPDDAIAEEVGRIAAGGGFSSGQLVVHASGVHGLAPLAAAEAAGARVACAHPLQSFVSVPHAVDELPGTVFGVTAEGDAYQAACTLVRAVGGVPVRIDERHKALYHAAATVASNHLVALEDLAAELFSRAGVPDDVALAALAPLLRSTVSNIRRFGTRPALTGPVARGDIETVRRHLAALEPLPAAQREAYRVLAARAVDMAFERGDLDEARATGLHRLLGGDESL